MLRRLLISLSRPHYVFRPRQLFRRLIRQTFSPTNPFQEVTLPWGTNIEINVNEHIGRAIWLHGLYDFVVSEALWRLTDPGSLVVDAGAHIGHMTSILAVRTGPTGHVLAFEPHPKIFGRLQSNVALFTQHPDTAPIKAYSQALSNQPKTICLTWDQRFESNKGTASVTHDSASGIQVRCQTLDNVLSGCNASVLKLDVEGHELQVLKGAYQALRKGHITHIIYEHLIQTNNSVHQFLSENGFSIFGLDWRYRGPILIPYGSSSSHSASISNYLATRYPTLAKRRFSTSGWHVS